MEKLLRSVIGLVIVVEAIAFLVGVALHLGVPLPVPFAESRSLRSAVLEAGSGIILLIAAGAALTHRSRAWKIAVAAHVAGVASITLGIAMRGAGLQAQSSHHPLMLLVLIGVLIGLSIPPCRRVLEDGKRRSKRRQILQSL